MLLRHIPKRKIVLLLGDLILIILSMVFAFSIRTGQTINILSYLTGASVFTIMIYCLTFYVFDLYNLDYKFKTTSYLTRLLMAVAVGSIFIAMVFYLLPVWKFSRDIYLLKTVFIAILIYLWRLIFEYTLKSAKKPKSIVIIGAGWSGQTICDVINGNKDYRIIGFIDDNPELCGTCIKQYTVLGNCSNLIDMADRKEINVAVIAITHEKKAELFKSALAIKMKGVEIYDMPSLYEKIAGRVP